MANSENQNNISGAQLDAEQLEKLRADSLYHPLFNYIEKIAEENVKQAHDSHGILSNYGRILTPDMLNAYPDSPTARRYAEASKMYSVGYVTLHRYHKQRVETHKDCEHLEIAFHNYALAEMCENVLFDHFRPPDSASNLIDQYLSLRPHDVLAEYFKVILILKPCPSRTLGDKYLDFELQKLMIRTGEEFVKKMESQKIFKMEKRILTDLLYNLGSIYSVTDQPLRSLHSFKKSYSTDQTNTKALYAVAFTYLKMEKHLDEAENMFLKFIEAMPLCDKQYPNAYYSLAKLSIIRDQNKDKAVSYFHLGEKAEENGLPFLKSSRELPQKSFVKLAIEMMENVKK